MLTLIAVLVGATPDAGAWLRFQRQSTGLCAMLPGGRARIQPYGVGSTYVLHDGFDVATGARDFRCGGQSPLLLGARGDLAYVSVEPKRSYREVIHVEPRAIAIAQLAHSPCVLLDTGTIGCPREYDGRPSFAQGLADRLAARGPIAEVLPDTLCARTRAGAVVCGILQQSQGVAELFTGVTQASVVEGGSGCAVKTDGTVLCVGDNRYGQRGVAQLPASQRDRPNAVPGLAGAVEVSVSRGHACARLKNGEVWCWGRADDRQLGEDGYDDAEKLPRCAIDQEAMDRQAKALAEAKAQCAKRAPQGDERGDDVCGRMLWNLERSGAAAQTIYKEDGVCEISSTPVRFHPAPVKVAEVEDAIAIAAGGSMTCALTKGSKLICWGFRQDEPRAITIPAGAAAPTPAAPAPRAPRPAISAALGVGVCVRTAEGVLRHVPMRDGAGLGAPTGRTPDVADLLCLPTAVCERMRAGTIGCASTDGQPVWGGVPQPDDAPGALTAMFGLACLLRADGVARCGPGFGSQNQNTRVANALSAAGAISDLAGACAVYGDGALRCVDPNKMGEPPSVVLEGVANADGPWGQPAQSGCAAMRDGTVKCLGDNSWGQRGAAQAATQPAVANTIDGLAEVEEVAGGGRHFCARTKAGEVFCWGLATRGETGKAARAKAIALPMCARDERHGSWKYATSCRTPGDGNDARFHPVPTPVAGVTGAIALTATDGLTCALLKSNAVACWGGGSPNVRTVKLE